MTVLRAGRTNPARDGIRARAGRSQRGRNEIRHQYLSAAKARRMLDWSPLFTLEQGLEQTIAWYREFLAVNERRSPACVARFSTWSRSITRGRFAAPPFVPGETPCRFRAGFSTPTDMQILVDSSLDFWLTTGRFAAQFEREFARFFGVRERHRW